MMSRATQHAKKWPEASLGEVADILPGFPTSQRVPKGTPTQQYPVIHVADLTDGSIPPQDVLSVLDLPRDARTEQYKVANGDILITARGTQLKVAWVCAASAGAIATSNLLIIRPGKRLRAALIFVFLQSPDGLAQLTRVSAGSTTLALRARDIAAVKMPIPPLKMQDTIADLVETAEQYYDAALRAATLRRTFGHALAQHLLQGQESHA